MINLDVKWSDVYEIESKSGIPLWTRHWLIPVNYRNEFFVYWKGNSFKLKDKGYGVKKVDNDWLLTETHTTKEQFSKKKTTDTVKSDEPLKPYEVKVSDGLRPWQVNAVSKLCAAIKKWGCAIDGSDVGVGKTYNACGTARELDMDILVVCPKAVMESWKRVIKNHFKINHRLIGVINYEMLRMGKKDSMIASYVKRRDTRRNEFVWKIPKSTLIIWDESQKLKGANTKNSETCLEALKQGYKMLFCSATNATNPLELKTVGMAIKLFENSKQYYTWLYAHGVTKGRFGLQFNNDKEVLKKLHNDIFVNRGVRLSRDTIPNFPESQIDAECYNMEEDAQNKINGIYAEMEAELAKLQKKIKKEIKENTSELTAILRARQKVELVKVPLFIEMIEEAVVHDLNGKHPRMSIISPSYSAVLMRQSTGRVWRDSAKSKSIQKIVFVANTVEEKVCESVKRKLDNMDLLNDGDLDL